MATRRTGTYSAPNDKTFSPTDTSFGAAMNTTRQAALQRLTALSLALLMTLGMLGTVNHLATSDANPAQMARAAAEAPRG